MSNVKATILGVDITKDYDEWSFSYGGDKFVQKQAGRSNEEVLKCAELTIKKLINEQK